MLALEYAVSPLDVARRAALRVATRSPLVTRLLSRRDTRIAALGTAQVLFLLGLTVRWPVALYFVGPVVLGVAHLAADVRYLALRLPLPRTLLATSVVIAVTLTAVRVCVGLHVANAILGARADVILGALWVGVALTLRYRPSPARLLVFGPASLAVTALLVAEAPRVDLALVHLHNVAAFVMWFALFRRAPGWASVPVVVTAFAVAFVLSGAYLPWTFAQGGLVAFGLHAAKLASGLAPGLSPRVATSVAATLVFLQSVHYAVWTGWIAQDCQPGEGTPTFRMTIRSLTADFGPVALGLILATMLGFAAFACGHLRPAVSWYMTVARAHVWFELAVFAYLAGRPVDVLVSRTTPRPR